jgi:hypothetical protein
LQTIAEKHPLDRVRLSAYGALASSSSDVDEAIAVWARIKESDSAFLREWRRVRTAELETLR